MKSAEIEEGKIRAGEGRPTKETVARERRKERLERAMPKGSPPKPEKTPNQKYGCRESLVE